MKDKKKDKDVDIEKAVLNNKEEFDRLTLKLLDLMCEFCLAATKAFRATKGELNVLQINQIVVNEFELTKAILSKPKFIEIVARKVEADIDNERERA